MNTEKKLMSLINSMQVLSSTLDLDEVLHQLINEVLSVIEGANASILFLYDENLNKLYAKTAVGFDMNHMSAVKLSPGEGMSGQTFLSGKGRIFSRREDTQQGMSNITPETKEIYAKSLGELAYPTSTLCVPLISKGKCIGVLTVDIFGKNVVFNNDDLKLLETFATQASIAVENAMLFSQNERSTKIHEELSKVSLSQGGLTEITETLGHLVKKDVAIYNEFFDVLGACSPKCEEMARQMITHGESYLHDAMDRVGFSFYPVHSLEGIKGIYCFPIRTDTFVIGLLTVFMREEIVLDPLDRVAIEQANTIFALEMSRQERILFNDFTYSGYILDQLLNHSSDKLPYKKLAKLNINESHNQFIVAMISINDSSLSLNVASQRKQQLYRLIYRSLSRFEYKTLVLDKNTEMTLLFILPEHATEKEGLDRLKELFASLNEASSKTLSLSLRAGLGRVTGELHGVKTSYRDARRCVQYMQTATSQKEILSYDELGPYRLIMRTDKDELEDYVYDILGPILNYDQKNQTELFKTLKVFLECNQNMTSSASQLYVHTNTIKYRLNTMKEILAVTSLEGRMLFDLQLGIYICEYLGICGNPTNGEE
ncbi:GAF domain-containing protein [Pseudalkalibacillus sp. JSM 102089]|uniref:GAF domain-containing protein n=1 Tax=Pseudalkalibacillus sp. JSM 102089 TaxID=3229856 RepID=UPI003523A59C